MRSVLGMKLMEWRIVIIVFLPVIEVVIASIVRRAWNGTF